VNINFQIKLTGLLFLFLMAPLSHSSVPSPEVVEQVVQHYLYGADQGPILFKMQFCSKIDVRPGQDQFSCLVPVSTPVPLKTKVFTVISFLVPQNGKYPDVTLQYLLNGVVRNTHDLTLKPSLRYFTVTEETFGKPGKWEVRVSNGRKIIGSSQIQVQ